MEHWETSHSDLDCQTIPRRVPPQSINILYFCIYTQNQSRMIVKNTSTEAGRVRWLPTRCRAIYCRMSLSHHCSFQEKEAAHFGDFFMAHEFTVSQLKTREGTKRCLNKRWRQWLVRIKPKQILFRLLVFAIERKNQLIYWKNLFFRGEHMVHKSNTGHIFTFL